MNKETYQDVAPPRQGQVYGLAHSATAARYETPKQWLNQMVTFSSVTSDLHVLFGGPRVKLAAYASNKYSTATGETLAAHWATGFRVPAGASLTWPVGADDTHFSVVSSAASGDWSAAVSSGFPGRGEELDTKYFGEPLLWLDTRADNINITSGAITVTDWRNRNGGALFSESSAKPDILDAASVSSGLLLPGVSFVAGSSEKLICTDATLAAALGSTNPFTLFLPVRRTATGALHTLFSVGTAGSNNGRWDVTLDASDDIVITRVTSGGSSSTSTYATTMSSAMWLLTIVFDGTTPTLYVDRTSQSLSGTATGDVGTTTKVAIGCRAYNTSTADQFASCEIPEVAAWGRAFSTQELVVLHAWAKRRYGK